MITNKKNLLCKIHSCIKRRMNELLEEFSIYDENDVVVDSNQKLNDYNKNIYLNNFLIEEKQK